MMSPNPSVDIVTKVQYSDVVHEKRRPSRAMISWNSTA